MRPGPRPRPVSPDLAAALTHYRRQAKLTTLAAAKRSGYTASAIYSWQQGRVAPSRFALRCLAQTYRVSVEALLSYRRPEEYRASRVGPWTPGRACESGWSWEAAAP